MMTQSTQTAGNTTIDPFFGVFANNYLQKHFLDEGYLGFTDIIHLSSLVSPRYSNIREKLFSFETYRPIFFKRMVVCHVMDVIDRTPSMKSDENRFHRLIDKVAKLIASEGDLNAYGRAMQFSCDRNNYFDRDLCTKAAMIGGDYVIDEIIDHILSFRPVEGEPLYDSDGNSVIDWLSMEHDEIGYTINEIALNRLKVGDEDALQKAKEIAKRNYNPGFYYDCMDELACELVRRGGEDHLKQALLIVKSFEDPADRSDMLFRIAKTLGYSENEYGYSTTVSIIESIPDNEVCNSARSYLAKKAASQQTALGFARANAMVDSIKDQHLHKDTLMCIAYQYTKKGDTASIDEALIIAKKIKDPNEYKNTLSKIVYICAQSGVRVILEKAKAILVNEIDNYKQTTCWSTILIEEAKFLKFTTIEELDQHVLEINKEDRAQVLVSIAMNHWNRETNEGLPLLLQILNRCKENCNDDLSMTLEVNKTYEAIGLHLAKQGALRAKDMIKLIPESKAHSFQILIAREFVKSGVAVAIAEAKKICMEQKKDPTVLCTELYQTGIERYQQEAFELIQSSPSSRTHEIASAIVRYELKNDNPSSMLCALKFINVSNVVNDMEFRSGLLLNIALKCSINNCIKPIIPKEMLRKYYQLINPKTDESAQ